MKADKKNNYPGLLFFEGNEYCSYKYLGVHRDTRKYTFRLFAPNALKCALVSDETGWNDGVAMKRVGESNVWEVRLYTCKNTKNETVYSNIEGMRYKFKISYQSGIVFKCDPYAFASQTGLEHASIVCTKNSFKFKDKKWEEKRLNIKNRDGFYTAPLNIYQIALSSFLTCGGMSMYDGECGLNYKEIADKLVPYIKQMGYTHVELIDLLDRSACSGVCSYYAPNIRFGLPDDFRYFVNKLHNNGIGVLAEWSLETFSPVQCEISPWHFKSGMPTVDDFIGCTDSSHYLSLSDRFTSSFLISNVSFWFDEFHLDGLVVDGLDSVIYLEPNALHDGEGLSNSSKIVDVSAIDFIKQLNYHVNKNYFDRFMISADLSSVAKATHDVRADGLGFSFIFNCSWTKGLFEYTETDPWFRKKIHQNLTLPMMYAYNEHYILPVTYKDISGKNESQINRMFGNYSQKFSGMRSFLVFRMTHPGKKLTFMGCEYGQFKKWEAGCQLEWFMLDFEMHEKLQRFTAEVNHLYLRDKRLYDQDFSWNGFQWIYADKSEENVIAFKRLDREGNELIVVINFSGAEWNNFAVSVDSGSDSYDVILNSESREFGGSYDVPNRYRTRNVNGKASIVFEKLPPLCAIVLEPKF